MDTLLDRPHYLWPSLDQQYKLMRGYTCFYLDFTRKAFNHDTLASLFQFLQCFRLLLISVVQL